MADRFIGTGVNPNPNVPDIPLGLGMALAQDEQAMTAFGNLGDGEKRVLIENIQSAGTGDEAKERIAGAVRALSGR